MDNSTSVHYSEHLVLLAHMTRGLIRGIDPHDELTFQRIRTRKGEMMIAPGK